LKGKISVLSIIAFSLLLCTSLVNAQVPKAVTVWANKSKYAPGETGTLYVAFYNDGDAAVAIKNVTITYASWGAYIGGEWVGNETITMDVPISGKATKLLNDVVDISFTVPSDGRAVSTNVQVRVGTDGGYETGSATINVPETPTYMDQIVTLFTILVVLIIVCTVIIAATMFLSGRRPQVTWKEEVK
jgi:hypothetical protein